MPKTNSTTLAYHHIRQKIITCEYAPGAFLNEEMLTEDMNLSRTPVRDALSRLEQEGLIQIRSKRGIMVTPLSVREINMIYEMRLLYEPYALLNYGTLLPQESLTEFYHIFSHKNSDTECFQNNDYFYDLDSRFHLMIIETCPNIYIHRSYRLIHAQDTRLRYMTGNVSNNRLEETFREHLAIIVPCLQGNWEKAAEKMVLHIEESKKSAFHLIFENSADSIHLQKIPPAFL